MARSRNMSTVRNLHPCDSFGVTEKMRILFRYSRPFSSEALLSTERLRKLLPDLKL